MVPYLEAVEACYDYERLLRDMGGGRSRNAGHLYAQIVDQIRHAPVPGPTAPEAGLTRRQEKYQALNQQWSISTSDNQETMFDHPPSRPTATKTRPVPQQQRSDTRRQTKRVKFTRDDRDINDPTASGNPLSRPNRTITPHPGPKNHEKVRSPCQAGGDNNHRHSHRTIDSIQEDPSHQPSSSGSRQADDGKFLGSTVVHDPTSWLEKLDEIARVMDKLRRENSTRVTRPVRVAVLDTGLDMEADCINGLGLTRPPAWKDYVGDSSEPVDDDGEKHGTAVAALLLRTATHADVYVIRIAENQKKLSEAEAAIEKAIRHAVDVWDVDIISISFGFSRQKRRIKTAINDAVAIERNSGGGSVLFFAAANNEGLNERELFPASDPNVIAVRGTNEWGEFVRRYNPDPHDSKADLVRFGTLGENIPYDLLDRHAVKSGCSFATPIFAGLVADVLQCFDYVCEREQLRRHLRTKEGLVALLKLDCLTQIVNRTERWHYLAPWDFFLGMDDNVRLSCVHAALHGIIKHSA
ncbi:hypothetical protein MAPG_10661 [Magnaporthiopsis poae ATCC 64411]|uniref:Peptidase S8/S53 domain-containing protein n=1 Tax=Magnaporthiopsis poae (strain ATCC 64411 / 73-15) TaxID=644358 RepID=A0A0C4ED68_MAGP6|nr:hypothetical protein MAPG_10661 [Magnaporthiopsis poae ATCC 64411]